MTSANVSKNHAFLPCNVFIFFENFSTTPFLFLFFPDTLSYYLQIDTTFEFFLHVVKT